MGVCLEPDERKDLKKMFPHLMRELETGENKIRIESVDDNPEAAETAKDLPEEAMEEFEIEEEIVTEPDKFQHYNPDVVDFLRRCDTNAQAHEIIVYLQKRGELSKEKACELKAQLDREGVRSFGPKKENDYYFKQSGLC
jgi:hypothetical protein